MRKLHLVGLTTDRDGLIFTARQGSKSGGFIVPLDDAVLTAVAEAQAERNGADPAADVAIDEVEAVPRRPRHQSALTPREMQARLRAGRSIDEVAAEAGVDNDWVARFAVPILAEQAQVVELARGLVYAKPRLGESSQALGPSVMQNLSDRGVFLPDDIADAGWSAFQLHDSVWMVRFRYRSRGRNQEAQWEVDVPAGRLQARNRHASDLGYVDPGRRRRVVVEEDAVDDDNNPAPAPAPRRPGRVVATPSRSAVSAGRPRTGAAHGGPTSRATANRPVSKAAASKVPTARVGVKAASSKAAATTAAATKAATRRVASKAAGPRAVTSKAAPSQGAGSNAARSKAAGSKAAGSKAAVSKSAVSKSAVSKSAATKAATGRVASKAAGPKALTSKSAVSQGAGSKAGTGGRAAAKGPAKVTRPVKGNGRTTARVASASAPAKVGTDGGPPKAAATRRPAKAAGATADAGPTGPTGHTGGVRSAVAQIAAARVTASMAAADRAPWAGVVAPRSISRLSLANGNQPGGKRAAPASPAAARAEPRAFEPRPLPKGGDLSVAARVRKLPTPPPRPEGAAPPVSLPAPRVPSPRREPIPVERPKRRRLRSR